MRHCACAYERHMGGNISVDHLASHYLCNTIVWVWFWYGSTLCNPRTLHSGRTSINPHKNNSLQYRKLHAAKQNEKRNFSQLSLMETYYFACLSLLISLCSRNTPHAAFGHTLHTGKTLILFSTYAYCSILENFLIWTISGGKENANSGENFAIFKFTVFFSI